MVTIGIPAASLGPAKPKKYKELTALMEIAVPVRGSYPEDFGKQGSYDISPSEGVFLFSVLTEVLLAYKAYPNLQEGQSFVIAGFDLHEEILTVAGRIVEVVSE